MKNRISRIKQENPLISCPESDKIGRYEMTARGIFPEELEAGALFSRRDDSYKLEKDVRYDRIQNGKTGELGAGFPLLYKR